MSRISIYVPQLSVPPLPVPEIVPIDGTRGLFAALETVLQTADAHNRQPGSPAPSPQAAASQPTDQTAGEPQPSSSTKDGVAGAAESETGAVDPITAKQKQDASAYAANALAKLSEAGLDAARVGTQAGIGHTLEVNDAFEKHVSEIFANAPNDFATQMLVRQVPRVHLEVQKAAIAAEAGANVARRYADAVDTLDIFGRLITADPSKLDERIAEARMLGASLVMSPKERAVFEGKLRELPLLALSATINRDPKRALTEMKLGQWSDHVDASTLNSMKAIAEQQLTLNRDHADAEEEFNKAHLRLELDKFGKTLVEGQIVSGTDPRNTPARFTEILGANEAKAATDTVAAQREIGSFFSRATMSSVDQLRSDTTAHRDLLNDAGRAGAQALSEGDASQIVGAEFERQLQPEAVRSSPPGGPGGAPQPQGRRYDTPDPEDIALLLANPNLRNEFEYRFGPAEQYLNQQQLSQLPPRRWDPRTMDRPARGQVRGAAPWVDAEGNKHPSVDGRLPNGSYRLPDVAPGKALPFEGLVPTRGPGPKPSLYDYYSGVFDPFGLYRQYGSGAARRHTGLDIAAPVGTRVHAAGSGTVFVRRDPTNSTDLGNVIGILHPDGTVTMYCHLKDINVRPGDSVMAGDEIGTVGVSGNAETQRPHLHFEALAPDPTRRGGLDFRRERRCIDPLEWLQTPSWYHGPWYRRGGP